jgi:hypothetical protein
MGSSTLGLRCPSYLMMGSHEASAAAAEMWPSENNPQTITD